MVITSYSLGEHPGAPVYVKVTIKAGQRGGGGICTHQALGASAVTWHLQPGRTQNGGPAGPTPV